MEHSPDIDKESQEFFNLPTFNSQPILAASNGQDSAVNSSTEQVSVEVNESITVIENRTQGLTENDSTVQNRSSPENRKRRESSHSSHEIDAESGSKRHQITVDEQQASVHVVYNSLTRKSRQKLEELLQTWSTWHARHHASCCDSKGELESGEGTYFPALDVGLDKPSSVSFWIDGQGRNSLSNDIIALNNNSIPLYDRGCSFGLTSTVGSSNVDGDLDTVDASRCFNCGSYNHALKECLKPRDNAAVNSARKQLKSRRNQNAISRNPTRYYQDTPGGKFDGLRPGVLDAETRKLLGIGELDPPPWLNRMREIGYPPGYLETEDEEQPSGIQIFGEEEDVKQETEEDVKQETEDGEILDTDCPPPPPPPPPPSEAPQPERPKKKSVEFPGVNAPIPENADEWRWGARAWNFDLPRNRSSSNQRSYNSTESRHHEQRWSHDYIRDDAPPGVDPGTTPAGSSYDYDSRKRSKRSPLIRDDDRWDPEERRHHGRR